MSKTRGRVQKKPRHQPPREPREKRPKPPPVDVYAVDGRKLHTKGMALLTERARAWRKLDRLARTEVK